MWHTKSYTKLLKRILFGILLFFFSSGVIAQVVRSYCIEVSCSARKLDSTRSILDFSWPVNSPSATSQYVYKKTKDAYQWNSFKTLATTDSTFSDTILTGQAYEYMVEKNSGPDGWAVYGYIYAGNQYPAVTDRGIVLIIADSTHKSFLENDIRTYRNDLIGDGWTTVLKYFSPSSTITQIKSYIYNQYSANPTRVKSVVLVGNLAVPFSGDFSASGYSPPDGHTTSSGPPSHEGAWSTDLYYADMINLNWPDSTVNNTNGYRPANKNVPNDGKFDVTELLNILQLQVGRIDLSDMTEFKYDVPDSNNIERELLKRYFQKNHTFRHKQVTIQERSIYATSFADVFSSGFINEHWPSTSYRNMTPMFGSHVTTKTTTYLNTLNSNSYLWSFAFGAGNYNQNNAVGYSLNLASSSQQIRSVFAGYLSSYCADFDTANNFLKAALASKGNILNTFWCGRPSWYFHHMALGETIGYSSMRTQSNYDSAMSSLYSINYPLYPTAAYSGYSIHSNLLGDPTVRLQPVIPATNFIARQDSCDFRFKLTWDASTDTAVHTYYIYRSKHIDSVFTLLGTTLNTNYTDSTPLTGDNVYMLRGSKLQVTGSGSYYNMFQGLFDTANTNDYLVPTALAGPDTSVCQNSYLRIGVKSTNNSSTTYSWTPSAGASDTATIQAVSSGDRILVAIDTMSGCTVRDTMTLSVITGPVSETISATTNFCNDSVFWSCSNNNGAAFEYSWQFSSGNPFDSSGLGLINPGLVTYGSAGSFATSLVIRDTSTNCTNTINSGVSVICIGLPVEWANLNCTKTGNLVNLSFNIQEHQKYRNIYIEILGENNSWTKYKDLEIRYDGRYEYEMDIQNGYGVRLMAIELDGEVVDLDYCSWDERNVQVKLYPNPVKDNLSVGFTSITASLNSNVIVYNALGQPVLNLEHRFSNGQLNIDCSKFSSGLYTVVIFNGNQVYSSQFVK